MKARLTLATCGTCGKSRGIRHECVTRATSRRRKRRTRIKPKVTVTCGKCGRRRGVRHTCTIRTDFKKRLRRKAREEKTAERRQRRKQATARRRAAAKARKAKAKTRPPRPRPPAHDWQTCRDADCEKYACVAYKQGIYDCPRTHQ